MLVDEVPRPGWSAMEDGAWAIALLTTLDDSLKGEGLARDFSHGIQGLRRQANLALHDRIQLRVDAPTWLAHTLSAHTCYICSETLCEELDFGAVKGGQSLLLGAVALKVNLRVITR